MSTFSQESSLGSDGLESAGSPGLVQLYTLCTHSVIRTLTFTSRVLSVRASPRLLIVALDAQAWPLLLACRICFVPALHIGVHPSPSPWSMKEGSLIQEACSRPEGEAEEFRMQRKRRCLGMNHGCAQCHHMFVSNPEYNWWSVMAYGYVTRLCYAHTCEV